MAYFSRGKNRFQDPYTFPDMYKEYIKDKEGPYKIPYSDFVDICTEFYKGIATYILEGGLYKLPFRLGEISVVKSKPKFITKRAPINWVETVKLGRKVVETNDHSSYYRFRFKWTKREGFVAHLKKYQIVFSRANRRRLAAIIKSGDYDFFNDIKYIRDGV